MKGRAKRLGKAWLPNLEGGAISFAIEVVIVVLVGLIGFAIAALALWIF